MEICDNVPWKLDHYRAAKRQWEGEEGYLGISDHCRKEQTGGIVYSQRWTMSRPIRNTKAANSKAMIRKTTLLPVGLSFSQIFSKR